MEWESWNSIFLGVVLKMYSLTSSVCLFLFISQCIAAPTKPSNGCGYDVCAIFSIDTFNRIFILEL